MMCNLHTTARGFDTARVVATSCQPTIALVNSSVIVGVVPTVNARLASTYALLAEYEVNQMCGV